MSDDETRLNETTPLTRSARLKSAGGAGAQAWVVLYHRNGARAAPLVPGKGVVVGRTAPADVVVPDASLSRLHARFSIEGTEVRVEDLGSTNGTWIGGEHIDSRVVRSGETVVLGAVTAVVHAATVAAHLGLDSHDRFLVLLDDEVRRARFFDRPLSLLMVRAPAERNLALVAPAVQAALRPIDRVALYARDVLEIVLPERGLEAARKVAEDVVAAGGEAGGLRCGVGSLPDCAATAEGLLECARTALRRADGRAAVMVAESELTRRLPPRSAAEPPAADIVAVSSAMKEVLTLAKRLARGAIPVLLHGETGTGKEVVARFIHEHGPLRDGPLVAVNSAALPPQLVESTLFGHERGAFTGAVQRHAGVFEAANGGSVFLDEIGELPLDAQAALLRVLESKRITRVGSSKEIPVDVRILAASHRDLEAMVAAGRFREDLLYRLNAMVLRVPALRERPDDVAPLASRFLEAANRANQRAVTAIAPVALAALEGYDWPGNVRELRNAIERGVVVAEKETLGLEDLPERIRRVHEAAALGVGAPGGPADATALRGENEDFRACMERLETTVLRDALERTGWNQRAAADLLGMPRRTLVYRLGALGLRKPR
jgi:two-component system, NtrC family, response regulator AtoC